MTFYEAQDKLQEYKNEIASCDLEISQVIDELNKIDDMLLYHFLTATQESRLVQKQKELQAKLNWLLEKKGENQESYEDFYQKFINALKKKLGRDLEVEN